MKRNSDFFPDYSSDPILIILTGARDTYMRTVHPRFHFFSDEPLRRLKCQKYSTRGSEEELSGKESDLK